MPERPEGCFAQISPVPFSLLTAGYINWLRSQPPTPQSPPPHAPICRAGQADSAEDVVCVAGTLNFLSNFLLPHEGQDGCSLPRRSNSNSALQLLQVYS